MIYMMSKDVEGKRLLVNEENGYNVDEKGDRKMDKKKIMSRIVAVALAIMVGATFSMAAPEEASAAVKKPKEVTWIRPVATTSKTIKFQWNKQKKVSGKQVKYIVKYKEKDTDDSWTTKKTSKHFITLKGLKPDTTYKIKVRGYIQKNNKTYKGPYGKSDGTTRIYSVTFPIDGKMVTITEGKTIQLPSPNGGEGYTVVKPLITQNFYKKKLNSISVEGTTAEGLDYYCTFREEGVSRLSVGDKWKYDGVHIGMLEQQYIDGEDATVYWTVDGTEPQAGQEDLFGKCRYTRDTYKYTQRVLVWAEAFSAGSTHEGARPTPLEDGYFETKLRGTVYPGESYLIYEGSTGGANDERVKWFKAYINGKLVAECFRWDNMGGYKAQSNTATDYDPERTKQVAIDAIKELDRFDEEYWGPGPF